MTRFAHIIAILFLLATMLGQSAGATLGGDQDMSCCDDDMMQQMHQLGGHENGGCTTEPECPGGDTCCTLAIHCVPALVPALDADGAIGFDRAQVEMAKLQTPDNALVARFAPPPIA